MRKNKQKLVLVLFLSLFVISILCSNINFKIGDIAEENDFSHETETIPETLKQAALDTSNLTINEGDELYEDVDYDFNASFYDTANDTNVFNSAYYQAKLVGDDVSYYNESISPLNNSETQFPNNSSISVYNGTWAANGTLGIIDQNNLTVQTEKVHGHYPATYSLEDDTVGGDPDGWTVDETGGTVNVIASLDGHNKVVELDDTDGSNQISITNSISQTSGTIELWHRKDTTSSRNFVMINDGATNIFDMFFSHDGNVYYFDGSAINLRPYSADTWYHIRIDFNCSTEKTSIWIDGVLELDNGDFRNSASSVDEFAVSTYNSETMTVYVDAVGYSWDADYNIGDNLIDNETSTINFTTTLDFTNYNKNFLRLDVSAYYKTNQTQTVNFSIYNAAMNEFELINSSSTTAAFYESSYTNTSAMISNLFNNTDQIVLKWVAMNESKNFEFYLDFLRVRIFYKLELNYTTSFSLLGNWKYRFQLFDNLGTSYYSEWVYFSVIETEDNAVLISNSEYLTDWIFISDNTPYTLLYNDEMEGTTWNWTLESSTSTSNMLVEETLVDKDTYTSSSSPNSNYGTNVDLYCFRGGTIRRDIFLSRMDSDYYITENSNFSLYAMVSTDVYDGHSFNIYNTTDFDENTLTYNNQPSAGYLINAYTLPDDLTNSYQFVDIDNYETNYHFIAFGGAQHRFRMYSKEPASGNKPYFINYVPKGFKQDGIVGVQTNTTETVTLTSPGYKYAAEKGDIIEITYNTTIDSSIDLFLEIAGEDDYKYKLHDYQSGNETIAEYFAVPYDMTIEDIRLEIPMTAEDNFLLDSIRVKQISSDYKFAVSPFGIRDIKVPADTYSIAVLESNQDVWHTTVMLAIDNKTEIVFRKAETAFLNIYLYDTNNEYLDYTDFKAFSNFTLRDADYTNQRISNYIRLDANSLFSIHIFDLFNQSIYSASYYEADYEEYIDITLDIYTLKIKNEAQTYINYTLSANDTSIEKSNNIFSGEIETFRLASGNYSLSYTNYENELNSIVNFELLNNRIIYINSTYFNVYFSLFDQNSVRLDDSLFKLYLNGTLKGFGFLRLETDSYNITVKDKLETLVFNRIVDLSNYTEYNIVINVSQLYLKNLCEEHISIEINSSLSLNVGAADYSILYLSHADYNISWTNFENNEESSILITLNSDLFIPFNSSYYSVYFSLFNYDGLGLNKDLFRFYINSERKDFGFNTLQYTANTLQVLDYFNVSLYSATLDLTIYTEFNIFVEVWEMLLINNYSHDAIFEVERNHITISQHIKSQFSFNYRFLPNVEYTIRTYYLNGTLIEEKEVLLDEQHEIVSFGDYFSAEIPPQPESYDLRDLQIVWGLLIGTFGLVAVMTYLVVKLGKENRSVRQSTKKRKSNVAAFRD